MKMVEEQLDIIFANLDGTMVDEKQIQIAFGSTLFAFLTDGSMSEDGRKSYYGVTSTEGA